jgi:hypothetical protein
MLIAFLVVVFFIVYGVVEREAVDIPIDAG